MAIERLAGQTMTDYNELARNMLKAAAAHIPTGFLIPEYGADIISEVAQTLECAALERAIEELDNTDAVWDDAYNTHLHKWLTKRLTALYKRLAELKERRK